MSPRPLFVVGPARSGTTLIARALDAHPAVRVAVDPLLPLLRAIRDALVAAGAPGALAVGAPFQDGYFDGDGVRALDAVLGGDLEAPIPPAALAGLRETLAARAAIEEPELAPALRALPLADGLQALRAALDAVAASAGPALAWAGVKEVWAADLVPALARAFPTARFVLVRRDPRAIAASNLGVARTAPGQSGHPPSAARHWRKQEALTWRYRADPALAERTLVVEYEAFVARPAEGSIALCGFLGVDEDARLADRMTDGEGRPWRANSSFASAGPGVRPELAASWRTRLDRASLAMVEVLCGLEMAAIGYAPSVPEGPSAHRRARRALRTADAAEWSWRCDHGSPRQQLDQELARRALVAGEHEPGRAEVRRAFLTPEAFTALRGVGARAVAA